jgi:hypothetical protein
LSVLLVEKKINPKIAEIKSNLEAKKSKDSILNDIPKIFRGKTEMRKKLRK